MLSPGEFTCEVSEQLATAINKTGPRELQWTDGMNEFCKTNCSFSELPERLGNVIKHAFHSHGDIRELLNLYADRLSWHVLPGERGMDDRDIQRLIFQTRDTERGLADRLTEVRCHLRSLDLKESERVREATVFVHGCLVHLRLLSLLVDLGDKASTRALQVHRKEYQKFVTEYRAARKQRCSVTLPDNKTEVTFQDSGRTVTVKLSKQAPEKVDLDRLIETYLDNIIHVFDFSRVYFVTITVPRLPSKGL